MKAVLIAYACHPGDGSEAGAGWAFVRAAAEVADVILFTTPTSREAIDAAIAEDQLPIEAHYIEIPLLSWMRFVPSGTIWTLRYLAWQFLVAGEVKQAEKTGHIRVVHHVTFASDSLPTALLASRAPVRIWGPVGGAAPLIPGLLRYFTLIGVLSEIFRWLGLGALRRTFGSWTAGHATLVLALNEEVRRKLETKASLVVVCSNTGLEAAELARARNNDVVADPGGLRTAVFSGRLLEWKGILLAIDAMAFAPDWRLLVVGDGPAKTALKRRAERKGVAERVELRGRVQREELLRLFGQADAMLFPSFHDSAPWAPAEASALGCPVVCLDIAGPPLQAGKNAYVVTAKPTGTLPFRLGQALQGLEGRGAPQDHLLRDRLSTLVGKWYRNDWSNGENGVAVY